MKHLQLTGEDLSAYAADIEKVLAGHYGQGWHASVKYHVGDGMYHVYDHDELVFSGDAEQAAFEFNSLRPR